MIHLLNSKSEIYFPDPANENRLYRTTHLGIGAHQDDLEMMAIHGILTAYDDPQKAFTGVTVTNGRGAPRSGAYADITDDDLWNIRIKEQKAAANTGKYLAHCFLNHPSDEVKSGNREKVVEDIRLTLQTTQPEVIYTHNLADKHDTHVAVALAVIEACRSLYPALNHVKLYGCEVWRSLDWLPDDRKIALDVSSQTKLQDELLNVFQSQIAGGKRYDLAAIGRRQANATFHESHKTDDAQRTTFALDLTPLIQNPEINIIGFMDEVVQALTQDINTRLSNLIG